MRKLIFSFVCVAVFTAFSYAGVLVPRFSVDIPGTLDFTGNYTDTRIGYSISLEYRTMISRFFALGVGAEHAFRRTSTELRFPGDLYPTIERNEFSFTPIYGAIFLYPFSTMGNAVPYIRANIGHNVLFSMRNADSTSPRMYWALGAGMELYRRFVFEIMTARYYGRMRNAGVNTDITYKKVGFNFGYRFVL
ncbi:MAG: hypothetical protein FWC85_01875 [Elusimicrobia bacterium]|nr:hypothetical protein [Elusimicrobiota bacterium]